MSKEELTLENLGKGVVHEKFTFELEKIMNNINDPNTDPEKLRKIEFIIKFKPSTDRGLIKIEVQSKATLAPDSPSEHHVFSGKDNRGKHIALVDDPKQLTLDDIPQNLNTLKEVPNA